MTKRLQDFYLQESLSGMVIWRTFPHDVTSDSESMEEEVRNHYFEERNLLHQDQSQEQTVLIRLSAPV